MKNKSNFVNYKNTLSKLIHQVKKVYFVAQFSKSQGSQKRTWRLINSLVGKHRKPSQSSEMIDQDRIMVYDEK